MTDGSRCVAHQRAAPGSFADKSRGSRQERGYGKNWEQIRLRIFRRDNGLCQECLRRGQLTAVGAEAVYAGTAISIGYAHTLTRAIRVDDSAIVLENPFDAGSAPAANGGHDAGHDAFGVALEISWE